MAEKVRTLDKEKGKTRVSGLKIKADDAHPQAVKVLRSDGEELDALIFGIDINTRPEDAVLTANIEVSVSELDLSVFGDLEAATKDGRGEMFLGVRCPDCETVFKNEGAYDAHECNPDASKFEFTRKRCPICEESFSGLDELFAHQRREHDGE